MGIRTRQTSVVVVLLVALLASNSFAGPRVSRGIAIAGVIAYQDDADESQFHYIPARTDVILGDTLKDFKATHWGIGPAHWAQDPSGALYPIAGAILSGRAVVDISPYQRQQVIKEITKTFGVSNPKLLSLKIKNVKVTPSVDSDTLALGDSKVSLKFPDEIQFGKEFTYTVGSGNSLFAQVVGARQVDDWSVGTNPHFAVNFIGEAEFVGDPWTAAVNCKLNQVWDQVRSSVNASVAYGWFRFGGSYNSIIQDLQRTGACSLKMKEGSLDTEKFGRQMFEFVRTLFEQINAKATAGDGFFKFEPNPEAPAPGSGSSDTFGLISINGGYSRAHFAQELRWETTIHYEGRFLSKVPASMVLAVNCNNATRSHFVDLGNPGEPCITQQKVDTFNGRAAREAAAKKPKLIELGERLALGQITQEQYDRLLKLYNRLSFTETINVLDTSGFQPDALQLMGGAEAPRAFRQGLTKEDLDAKEAETIKKK